MAKTKVSALQDANGIATDDLFYISKKNSSNGYDSRKATMDTVATSMSSTIRDVIKEEIKEEIKQEILSEIGDIPEIAYSYRNGWLDYDNAFIIDAGGANKIITLPMDAYVANVSGSSTDTPSYNILLPDFIDSTSTSNNVSLWRLVGNMYGEGFLLPAGTRFIIGSASNTSVYKAYVIPLVNGRVIESPSALATGDSMTWFQLSDLIESWGENGHLQKGSNVPDSVRYGIYVSAGYTNVKGTGTNPWWNNISTNGFGAAGWTHISYFTTGTGSNKQWSQGDSTPTQYMIYCPFELNSDNKAKYSFRLSWIKSYTTNGGRTYTKTNQSYTYAPGDFGTSTTNKNQQAKLLSYVVHSTYPTTLNKLSNVKVTCFDMSPTIET